MWGVCDILTLRLKMPMFFLFRHIRWLHARVFFCPCILLLGWGVYVLFDCMTTLVLMFVFLALTVVTILLSFGKMFFYLQQKVILYHFGLGIVVFDVISFNLSGFSKCSCAYTYTLVLSNIRLSHGNHVFS